jgi:hypothetical protein
MTFGFRPIEYFVVVRGDNNEIVASTTTLAGAEAVRDSAEQESGEPHRCLPASPELANAFLDWAWRTETVHRDGVPIEMAVIDR